MAATTSIAAPRPDPATTGGSVAEAGVPFVPSIEGDLRDAVFPADALERAQSEDVSLADVRLLFDMARIGLHRGNPWRPAPRMVSAFKRIKLLLEVTGKLPS